MGTHVYATSPSTDNVLVIDTATNTVTATIPVGDGPSAFGQFIGGTDAGGEAALAITNVSVYPVGGTPGSQITQGAPNTVEVSVKNIGTTASPAQAQVPIGLFALDAQGNVIQAKAFEASLPPLAPSQQTKITSPTTSPLTLFSTETTHLELLPAHNLFQTSLTTPVALTPEAARDLACFDEIIGLAAGRVCTVGAIFGQPELCIPKTGLSVIQILDEALFSPDIGDAIKSQNYLEASIEAVNLFNDLIQLIPGVPPDQFTSLVDGIRVYTDSLNGESCIPDIGSKVLTLSIGFFSGLETKAAEAGKKLLSVLVHSPVDLFVSDRAGHITSVAGTGTATEGIPASQGLLWKTTPPIKIVNVLGATYAFTGGRES
jgi:YVTN family beta-propeller protein